MKRLEVEFVNSSCALLRGYGARDLVVELKKRPPVWATRDRAWVVQPDTARDIIAAAEAGGWEVLISGARPLTPVKAFTPAAGEEFSSADPGAGLW